MCGVRSRVGLLGSIASFSLILFGGGGVKNKGYTFLTFQWGCEDKIYSLLCSIPWLYFYPVRRYKTQKEHHGLELNYSLTWNNLTLE